MFCRFVLLTVSLMSFLRGFHGCDTTCADKPVFTPSRLAVKFGDPTNASCSVCQHVCDVRGLERSLGDIIENGTTIHWTVDSMTVWETSPICYYNDDSGRQCCSNLPVTVYQPPDNVSISFVHHTGPMFEGHQYTLQCTVQDAAPVGKLIVTFYRGQTALGQLQSKNNKEKKPVTESFTLDITPSNQDDGAQYWCEAKLDLGPEGPHHPPVVMSQSITATVHYKPKLEGSSQNDSITVTEGDSLHLNCSAVGVPSPSYTWTLPSASPSPFNGSVLTVKSTTSADGGQYTCSVSNTVGTVTVTFNVDFQATATISTTTTATANLQQTPTVPSGSTSSKPVHWLVMCFTLLFSALV